MFYEIWPMLVLFDSMIEGFGFCFSGLKAKPCFDDQAFEVKAGCWQVMLQFVTGSVCLCQVFELASVALVCLMQVFLP